jgi:hypothetical protein
MPACTGVAIMGSLQQPLCTKLQNNFCGYTTTTNGFLPQFQQLNFNNNFKPCKVSHVEGTLVTGNPSPLSSVPQIGGSSNLPFLHSIFFTFYYISFYLYYIL